MRPAPNAAGYLAANRNFAIFDVYTFVTVYGDYFLYSGTILPVTVPGNLIDSASVNAPSGGTFIVGPPFGRTQITTKIGVQPDKVDIQIHPRPIDLIGNSNFQYVFWAGLFDGATIELGRVICQPAPGGAFGPVVSYVVWFQGILGDVEIGRSTIKLSVNSTTSLLKTQYPRRMWQNQCGHIFGDAMCQFDRQSMAATVVAQAGSEPTLIVTSFIPTPNTLYDDGTAIGLSGQNTGKKRTIAVGSEAGTYYLTAPFIWPIAVGDNFELLPGCDHTLNTCQNVFNNLIHYGGFPYIPPAEFAIAILGMAWLGSLFGLC